MFSLRSALLAVLVSPLVFPPLQEPVPREPITVFLVRHAEADASDPADRDPGLSPRGVERARTLARVLGEAGVTHLFCSEYERTRATLAPLAQRCELEVETVSARDAARQVAVLRALPAGSVAVVAGHSNTVPALTGALLRSTEEETPRARSSTLPHDAHDRMFLVTLPMAQTCAPKSIELRYGE